jgi:alpha-galactosidase
MPRLTRLIPIALLIALASGCGGGGGAEQASGGVTLRYGLWDPNQEPVYQKCADRFEQANPGIDVKLEVNNWGDYWSSLARGFVAETAPDVFTDHLSKYPQFVESEVIEPVNARQADMGAYLPGLANLWRTPSGKQYGFPKDWDTVAIVVNEDMLRDAGVTKAELDRATWNPTDGGTFERIAARLSVDRNGVRGDEPGFDARNVATYGLGLDPNGLTYGQTTWAGFARSLGFELLDKNPWGTHYNYDDPRFVQTMAWWRRMIEQGYMPSLTEARTLGQTAMFQGGKAAMAIDGSWQIGTYSATEGIRVGFSPQPAGPEGSWSMYNGLADAIWVGTKHPAEARKWDAVPRERRVPADRRHRGGRVPRDRVGGRPRGRDAPQARRRRQRLHLLPGRRAHDALPDHRQGAPDQPAGRAHAGEDPARQRGPCGGAEGRERRRQRAAGVRVMTSSTRAAAAAHLSSVAVALGVVAAAGRPVLWAGAAAFLGPLAARLALRDAFAAAPRRRGAAVQPLGRALHGRGGGRAGADPDRAVHRAADPVPRDLQPSDRPQLADVHADRGAPRGHRADVHVPDDPRTELMPKVAFIGAGSAVFTRNLVADILGLPELRDTTTFSLMDIDGERLGTAEVVARRLVDAHGAGATVEATQDRRAALEGADYVVTSFQVGGYRPSTVVDFEVPKRYGLRQTIADTLGVGGIMRALRTIPVLLDVCRDMEELSPDALLLNYVNPMAMLCWAVAEASPIRTVGLCHSVQHTARELASDLGLPAEELDYHVAGINHVAFFLRLEHEGEDLYPALRRVLEEERMPDTNRVRYELMRRFGYFVTESSEHFAEYVPWFIKDGRPDLIERFNIPLDEYPRRCERQLGEWAALRAELERSDALSVERSDEYGADIIRACETGDPYTFNGNVPNRHRGGLLIDNLPADCCVEVPCVASADGIEPQRVGALPRHLAALMQTNINVQGLTVEAALTGRRAPVQHAAMLDPHTAAELSLDEIAALVDDLLDAHGAWIPPLAHDAEPLPR